MWRTFLNSSCVALFFFETNVSYDGVLAIHFTHSSQRREEMREGFWRILGCNHVDKISSAVYTNLAGVFQTVRLCIAETDIPDAMRHKRQIGREQAKIQALQVPQLRYFPEFFLDDRCYVREPMHGLLKWILRWILHRRIDSDVVTDVDVEFKLYDLSPTVNLKWANDPTVLRYFQIFRYKYDV
jgi:hypothetical protein